jgi:hypothetical protein
MNEADTTRTLARLNAGIILGALAAPAELTHDRHTVSGLSLFVAMGWLEMLDDSGFFELKGGQFLG